MPQSRGPIRSIILLLGVVTAPSACGSSNVLGPDNNVQISNNTDTFEWQASSMDNITQTLSYFWQNTETTANVNQSPTLSGGSATLTISDADGTRVYARSLGEGGTFTTTAGTSGEWTIEVKMSGASGGLNFRAEKP